MHDLAAICDVVPLSAFPPAIRRHDRAAAHRDSVRPAGMAGAIEFVNVLAAREPKQPKGRNHGLGNNIRKPGPAKTVSQEHSRLTSMV
jgi:hypothetical protein